MASLTSLGNRRCALAPGAARMALAALLGLMLAAASPRPGWSLRIDLSSFTLDNGMQVVVIPDHRAPVVTHMVWYRVGSADEPPGKSGLAHLLEHLMFKGTDKVGAGEFSKIIARNGGRDNAFTSLDYTGYFQRIARDRLDLLMRLEADRMTNLKLTEAVIEPERAVVLEERRSRVDNHPRSRLTEQVNAVFYLAHPYGTPVIGWEADIRGLTREDIVSFYERYYSPENAILVVAGDVTAEEVRGLAEKHYGPIAPRGKHHARVRPAEPPHQAERQVTLADPRVKNGQLQRSYLTPSYHTAAPGEAAAIEVLAEALGGDTTSLLYRRLVVDRKLAASAGVWYSGDNLDNGRFNIYAAVAPSRDLAALEKAIDETIAEVLRNGLPEDEIARARRSLVAQAVYARDSQQRLARVFGTALTTGQSVDDVIAWTERIGAVTPEAVHAAAKRYLGAGGATTGVLLPGQDEAGTKAGAGPKEKRS